MSSLQLTIVNPGALATLQDAGRLNWESYGVPSGGYFDRSSASCANWLVDNPSDHPVLEITGPGFEFYTEGQGSLAITGAQGQWLIDQEPIPIHQTIPLEGKHHFLLSSLPAGYRSYIGIQHTSTLPTWLGSVSPILVAGRFEPGASLLRKGQQLRFETPATSTSRHLPEELKSRFSKPVIIRLVPGPEFEHFSESQIHAFTEQVYTMSSDSDKMGIRMQGQPLDVTSFPEMISSGILPGTIQINRSGLPMVLGPDCQTMGGYPRIGVVIPYDMEKIAQVAPGGRLQFQVISRTDGLEVESYVRERRRYLMGGE